MEELTHSTTHSATLDNLTLDPTAAPGPLDTPVDTTNAANNSVGSSIQTADQTQSVGEALGNTVPGLDPATRESSLNPDAEPNPTAEVPASFEEHDHSGGSATGNPAFHVALDNVANVRQLNTGTVRRARGIAVGGDFLDPGEGDNTVIGTRRGDVIFGNGGGFNTITTGTGRDVVVLGAETTNRIFDFDPTRDRFALTGDIDLSNIVIAQGLNPGRGGLSQPLDSQNNALVIDRSSGHILASLSFTNSSALSEANFAAISSEALEQFGNTFTATQEGSGQLTGTLGRDKLVGQASNDFLFVGDDGFRFGQALSGEEFPFATDSPGRTKLTLDMDGGVLRINGNYSNFDGAPLFSQGETAIDPTANIPNGANPDALVRGFLSVPNDVEGNPLSGSHLHFSPAADSRGNFADATVIRFLENTPTDAKSGTIAGEFELTPEEQAALLGGNFYVNIHTNADVDGDGKGGFPTGESRINLNRNVVRFV